MHEKILTCVEPPLTLLQRLDPRIKIVCALVWAVSVVSLPTRHTRVLTAYGAMLLILVVLGHAEVGKFLRRLAAALPLILLLVGLLPFFSRGQVVWQMGPLQITEQGLESAQRVGVRAVLCLAMVCLLWATTPEAQLIAAMRGLGLPAVLAGAIAFMLRYLYVLRPELHRLWDARAARTVGTAAGVGFRSAANLLGAFFLRAHDRALRVSDAMAARGYQGRSLLLPRDRFQPAQILVGVTFIAVIIGLRWLP